MTDDLYYRKLESTSTSDLVDILRERDVLTTQVKMGYVTIIKMCSRKIRNLN